VVNSSKVQAALAAQKYLHGAVLAEKISKDPHAKLPTDVMSDAKYNKAHDNILKRMNWQDLQLAWSVCESTFIRYGSYAKLNLGDIRADFTHGPSKDTGPGNKGMISFVLRPGGIHKDQYKHTKVVGSWRHTSPYRCATGSLAMNLLVRFRNDPKVLNMNFYGNPDPDAGADWLGIPLRIKWNQKSKSAETAYKSVYHETGINWCKCLHHRKGGMDKAGSAGLDDKAVGSMSKHTIDKIRQYAPELHADVMKVMAGFETSEE